ncbi:hypothetical protein Pryu01_01287 [Paraliobacillus ryukyuensis]|uniref:Uroporphyrinogen-III synthase n=1 Tax=Paraliobacillus ryukyuensis TaxID=200904 RepID=A0A366ECL2_9BACI|nr:uroporphyrinogen-III synthase [Paraliobacillus ryukyuensis]RBO99479.1 uroporphyrinogen-III synthase [Paraliobacillus ryukyuensis]
MKNPMKGKNILVTRSTAQAKPMMERLRVMEANPVHIPLITFQAIRSDEIKQGLETIEQFQWLFFTSANGVRFFFDNLQHYGIVQRKLDTIKFAVIGEKTDQMLQLYGYQASFFPSSYQANSMGKQFVRFFGNDKRVLLVVGSKSTFEIQEVLQAEQVQTTALVVYETVYETAYQQRLNELIQQDNLDVYTFTSPSTVVSFDNQTKDLETEMKQIKATRLCVCIGSTTKEAAQESGFQRVLTPKQFTTEKMIQTIFHHFLQESEGV